MNRQEVINHPANSGLDFHFDGAISERVLKNYLARAMSLTMLNTDHYDEDIAMVIELGVKYIGRSYGAWIPSVAEYEKFPLYAAKIRETHEIDPDIVFEGCIFETTCRGVENIPIEEYVFKAFHQPTEKRCFSYEKMLYESGGHINQWGKEISVPDMTRLETQMFFFQRACTFINIGFEAFHMGQMNLMTENDTDRSVVTNLFAMIRSYAKAHARRHMILINAHTHGEYGNDGLLLYDFHSFPTRIASDTSHIRREPSFDAPQEAYFEVNTQSLAGPIYKRSLGGITHSGWRTEHLPYFVELDNYGYSETNLNESGWDCFPWGYDEISWYANQPYEYRKKWTEYAYEWVRKNDPAGYYEMPGSRPAVLYAPGNEPPVNSIYFMVNDRSKVNGGFDDEKFIKDVFVSFKHLI